MTTEATAKKDFFTQNSKESVYSKWDGKNFTCVASPEKKLPDASLNAFEDFRAQIAGNDFSCIGAKAALNGSFFRIAAYGLMNSTETSTSLGRDLFSFADEQKTAASNFATFVAIFELPKATTEEMWEIELWKQLGNLHGIDPHPIWDPSVGSDPEVADFSFSFAGTGFFIVGLHPQSSRMARRFSRAAMVFNPHAQFERLRETDQYERMQKTIRTRELKLQGSLNPNLSDFGTKSEARQYSGRAVEENWKCPFHALMQNSKNSK